MRVPVRSVTQTRRRKALWKLTELWKNQRTVFPQLLEPSVHSFHNAGCCWNLKHNISCTPRPRPWFVILGTLIEFRLGCDTPFSRQDGQRRAVRQSLEVGRRRRLMMMSNSAVRLSRDEVKKESYEQSFKRSFYVRSYLKLCSCSPSSLLSELDSHSRVTHHHHLLLRPISSD